MKRCSKCGEDKPLDEFWRRKTGPDGRRGSCADCTRQKAQEDHGWHTLVSVVPLREAFERSELSFCKLAWSLGYTRVIKGTGWVVSDPSPVRRALGLQAYNSRGHRYPAQKFMREATALRYAEALGLDPVDIGL